MEEEHQTWYFFTTTIHLMLFVKILAFYLQKYTTILPDLPTTGKPTDGSGGHTKDVSETQDTESKIRLTVMSDTGESGAVHQSHMELEGDGPSDTSGAGSEEDGPYLCDVLSAVAVLILCRIARAWNRTGDKWAALPDVGDWLVR